MTAAGTYVANFRRVVLREDVLDAEVPVDGVTHLLVGQPGRRGRAGLCRRQSGSLRRGLDAAAGKETGYFGHRLVHRGSRLWWTGIGTNVIEDLIVRHAKAAANRRGGAGPRRICESEAGSEVLLLWLGLEER